MQRCIPCALAGSLLLATVAVAHPNHGKEAKTAAPAASVGVGPGSDTGELDDDEELEEVEEVTDLDDLDDDAGGTAPTREPHGFGWLIGYFHSAAVHLPIAWVLLLVAVDIAALLLGRKELIAAGTFIALLAALSFLPAALTGLLRFDGLNLTGPDAAPALLHRNIELLAAALMITAAALRASSPGELTGVRRNVYLGLVIAAAAAVTFGGHLGGQMIFGPIGS